MRDTRQDTVVFESDGWKIVKSELPELHGAAVIFAQHRCYEKDKGHGAAMNCWHTGDSSTKCILCNTQVPDEIQCLIALYLYGREDEV